MGKNKVIVVQNINITVSEENFDDYICITDIAKAKSWRVQRSRCCKKLDAKQSNFGIFRYMGTDL